ncbi:hypothetical protein L1887_26394 [Cichorium endivia]|nr:hypothetical protein L1887_26394 [Cichorium endivia]
MEPLNMSHSKHILVYPFPMAGHIIPLLDLTDLLLHHGLTITVIISPANLPLLDPLLSSHPSSLHKLLFSEPDIDPSLHPVIGKLISTEKLYDPIAKWFKSHPWPPVAIISDFFLGWTSELASDLGIRRVVFNPSGVLGSSIYQTMWRDVEKMNTHDSLLSFPEIPNSPEFPSWQLPPIPRVYKNGGSDLESLRKRMLANMTSWGIVYNTFEELEGVYIDHIKKQMGHDRVWAVGPLLPNDDGLIATTGRGGSSVVPPGDLLMWLDDKPDDSVVYICFGSLTTLNEKQMGALTGALEVSNVKFILCVNGGGSGSVPIGFEDRYTDEKLLVDELGVGKRVCKGLPDNVPDSVELARLLDESLSENMPERVKVKKLSQAASKAIKEGTSMRDLDVFTKLLSEL